MKLSLSRVELLRILTRCASVVSKNSVNPIFNCVKLVASNGRLQYAATSDNTALHTSGNVAAGVASAGSLLVGAHTLLDRIRSLDSDDVTLSLTGTQLTIRGAARKFTLATIPTCDYPTVTKPAGWSTNISSEALTTALDAVKCAASIEANRPQLSGVAFWFQGNRIDVGATDGHRMHMATVSHESERRKFLVPNIGIRPLLSLLADTATLTLTASDAALTVSSENEELTIALAAAEAPPMHHVIPERQPTLIPVNRKRLLGALEIMVGTTHFTAENGIIRVESTDVEAGGAHDELSTVTDVRCDGICFAPRLMGDALAAHTDDDVIIGLDGQLDQITVRGAQSNELVCVVMPVGKR